MKLTLFALLLINTSLLVAETAVAPGASYDLGFSPGGTSLDLVLRFVAASKTSLQIACYEFTSQEIADALIAAKARGVKIFVVADWKASREKYSQITALSRAGIPIRLNKNYAIHHNKFMVADGSNLETGSFNYSEGAVKRNAENVLVLWNVPNLALRYAKEWKRLWDEGQ